MIYLILGLILFFGPHLVALVPPLKAMAVARLGASGYRIAFSIIALIGLGLIVWGKSVAPFDAVYDPPGKGRYAALWLVLLACLILPAYALKGYFKALLRHPMSIAIALWAVGHLAANGDLASMLLFGSFGLYGVIGAFASSPPAPFQPRVVFDIASLIIGALLFAGLLRAHGFITGVPLQ